MSYSLVHFSAHLDCPRTPVWLGNHPVHFITSDGSALSFEAAKKNRRLIRQALSAKSDCGWRVIGCEVNFENQDLYCKHSGVKIEPVYETV